MPDLFPHTTNDVRPKSLIHQANKNFVEKYKKMLKDDDI